jgi:hypothetical protein
MYVVFRHIVGQRCVSLTSAFVNVKMRLSSDSATCAAILMMQLRTSYSWCTAHNPARTGMCIWEWELNVFEHYAMRLMR